MLPFIRADLAQFTAYTPHPEEADDRVPIQVDPLDTNEAPYDLPSDLKQKLASYYEQGIAANRYPDGSHNLLKRLIAAYVNEGLPTDGIDADWISLGNGSDELIRSILIATCVGNAGSVLVASPTFSMYAILAQTLGISVVTVARDEGFAMVSDRSAAGRGAIALSQANAALANHDGPPVRVVFVVHPNSPTGNCLSPAEIEWLQGLSEDILVVVDEAYFEFSQQTLVAEVLTRPNWVVTRTFSKAFRLAAHRVGYAIAHPALIQILEKVRLPYNLPALSLAAAQVALENRQVLLATLPEVTAERERLRVAIATLPSLTQWPSQANFIYVRAATPKATAALAQALKQRGTRIRHTGGGLRITIGSPAENSRTIAHLKAVCTAGLDDSNEGAG